MNTVNMNQNHQKKQIETYILNTVQTRTFTKLRKTSSRLIPSLWLGM